MALISDASVASIVQSICGVFSTVAALATVYLSSTAANEQSRYKRLDWSRNIVEKLFNSRITPAIEIFEREVARSVDLPDFQSRIDAFQSACIDLQREVRQASRKFGRSQLLDNVVLALEKVQDDGLALLSTPVNQISAYDRERTAAIASHATSALVGMMLKLGADDLNSH
jgi:hypothetical protein